MKIYYFFHIYEKYFLTSKKCFVRNNKTHIYKALTCAVNDDFFVNVDEKKN